MDTDCGGYLNADTMTQLLSTNQTIVELGDTALGRLFDVQMRLGFFDPRSDVPWAELGEEVVDTPEHRALSKQAADQSLVLLQNEQGTLPLDADVLCTNGKTVAVVGRNALATNNMLGNYFGTPPYLITPCDGVSAVVGTDALCNDGSDGGDATVDAIAAGKISAVVLVVGLTSEGVDPPDEAEGHDRTSLLLPLNQDALIARVAAAAAEQRLAVAVVVMSGGPVDLTQVKADPNVGAILWCGYPGQSGGAAIADALFGNTNPSGKLTMTWYDEGFAKAVSLTDMGMRPNATTGNPGRSHRFYTGTPVFAFGEGLSYTAFDVEPPAVMLTEPALAVVRRDAQGTRAQSAVVGHATVRVTNVGKRSGAASIILYAAPPPSTAASGAPRHMVVDFGKVLLEAGESAKLAFDIRSRDLTYADSSGRRVTSAGAWRFWTGKATDGNDAVAVMLE